MEKAFRRDGAARRRHQVTVHWSDAELYQLLRACPISQSLSAFVREVVGQWAMTQAVPLVDPPNSWLLAANAKCHHVNQPDCHQSRSIRDPWNTGESAPGAGIHVWCTAKAHGLHQNANDHGRTPSLHPSLPIRTLR